MNKISYRVSDILTEYMAIKIHLGYECYYTFNELVKFLRYIYPFVEILDFAGSFEDNVKKYLEKEKLNTTISDNSYKGEIKHNCDVLSESLIKPTYDLSLNPVMDIVAYENLKYYIESFLIQNHELRKINEPTNISSDDLLFGELGATCMVNFIWTTKVKEYINRGFWSRKCTNINEFLLDIDLAPIIKLPAMQEELFSLYEEVSRKLAVLSHFDELLKIENDSNKCLANSNYLLITKDIGILKNYNYQIGIDKEKNMFYQVPNKNSNNIYHNNLDDDQILKLNRNIKNKISSSK